MTFLHDLLSSVFQRQPVEVLREDDRSFAELCQALLAERGERTGNRLSRSILARFENADDAEREAYFRWLAEELDVDPKAVLAAAQRYDEDSGVENLATLMASAEPARQELFRRLNRLSGATTRLVEMRRYLLDLLSVHPELARVDLDFQHLFATWFNRGFLVLRDIDWHAPANVLEKIIAYEAVHAIDSWEALRQRVEPEDRRCFAFFHPTMLDEPLIFVEVALTDTTPQTIGSILDPERTALGVADAHTAVFYSISNCQRGLAGVSMGNSLIKQVVSELSVQLPTLTTFRTLSPVPGFLRWLESARLDDELQSTAELAQAIGRGQGKELLDGEREAPVTLALEKLLAHYLIDQRRDDAQPIDSVARFHLGNGASLDAILPAADLSERGRTNAAGIMVSYLYDRDQLDINQEAYAQQRHVAISAELQQRLGLSRRVRSGAHA